MQDADQTIARDVVRERVPTNEPKITVLGQDTLRVQTEQLDSAQTNALAQELASGYGVDTSAVSTSFVGPVWSGDITQKMLRGVVVFLVLVALTMALYFRNLKASLAARELAGAALLGAGVAGDFSASCDGAPSGAVVLSGAVRSCTAHLLPEVVILRVHGPWSFS